MGASSPKTRILAVDDNEDALFALERLLSDEGYDVVTATSGAEALRKVDTELPELVLCDVQMPGEVDGFAVARALKADELHRYIPVILLTAKDSIEDVIAGLSHGADDYIRKPFHKDELLARLGAFMRMRRTYLELKSTVQTNAELRNKISERLSFANIIGKSAPMQDVFTIIEKIRESSASVLITGESGTGKELVASAIHYNSPRRQGPFIIQNCSAFNENLLERELFGHVKGAFTGAVRDKAGLFQAADGGTFFLDELGEMSPALQVKLLRLLQDGTFIPVGDTKVRKVDVRIIGATHRNLTEMVQKGTFREDLYYRLNVVTLKLPPLRERPLDIPLLADHFLAHHAAKTGGEKKRLSPEALKLLTDYGWPGNVRQLQNEIERLVLMSGKDAVIDASVVSSEIRERQGGGASAVIERGKLKDALENLERTMILGTLERLGWNKSEAARELGISRSNLIAKVQSYGIDK